MDKQTNQGPQDQTLPYDEIAKLVGFLYIDNYHRMKIIDENVQSLTGKLQGRIDTLLEENFKLKEELRREKNNGRSSD